MRVVFDQGYVADRIYFVLNGALSFTEEYDAVRLHATIHTVGHQFISSMGIVAKMEKLPAGLKYEICHSLYFFKGESTK